MTMQLPEETRRERRTEWLNAIDRLIAQVETWCHELGWTTARESKHIDERLLGGYEVPVLHARVPGTEIYISPVALHIVGANGRVDIEAWPTLNRVKLIRDDDAWQVVTDSNVRLREAWNRDTFAHVVQDLSK